jgi:hypothetical protein
LTKKIIYSDQLRLSRQRQTYLIGSLGDISLEHESLLDFVEHSLGLVEGSGVNTDYSSDFEPKSQEVPHTVKTTWYSLLDSLDDVLSLEVDSDDLWADCLGHSESGWDSVDSVDFGSSLEECPLDDAELWIS